MTRMESFRDGSMNHIYHAIITWSPSSLQYNIVHVLDQSFSAHFYPVCDISTTLI